VPKIDLTSFLAVPRVVATVHRAEDLDCRVPPETCDLLEYRLDNLRDHFTSAERSLAASSLPCLITARHPAEGGAGDLDAAERRELLLRALPHAALMDVELRSLTELADVVNAAHSAGVGVVASYHDFEKAPEASELMAAFVAGIRGGADVVKIAVRLQSMKDLSTLALLTELAGARSRISTMGMGPLGKVSRLVMAAAGSCLNYGYLQEPNAPGQWPAGQLMERLREIGAREI
jgi:3-dehydroquinate dehydratase-1